MGYYHEIVEYLGTRDARFYSLWHSARYICTLSNTSCISCICHLEETLN